jgi:dethiobiotin synthetase
MTGIFPKSFFVTGTDTGVGKTVVSAILALGLSAHYWKPVQAGMHSCTEQGESILTDSEFLSMAGVESRFILKERHLLREPLSPHLAARLDNITISLADFVLPDTSNMKHLIVEGAGGLMVPLNDQDKVIDLIVHLGLPVLLVARSGLGTINHTLLSLAAMREKSLDIIGVALVGDRNTDNRRTIEQFGSVEVVAEVPLLTDFRTGTFLSCFKEHFVRRQNQPCLEHSASL